MDNRLGIEERAKLAKTRGKKIAMFPAGGLIAVKRYA